MIPRTILGSACVLLLTGAAACSTLAPARHEQVSREVEGQRSAWEARGVEDYRYVAVRGCFCPLEIVAPVVVEVQDGEVVSRRYAESGEQVPEVHEELWPALEGVFDLVEEAVTREADEITVAYDPEWGYPASITIDYMQEAADEELRYQASGFELLEEAGR